MSDSGYPDFYPESQASKNKIEPDQPPVEVPAAMISADALTALIAEFILREGTDYGRNETEHETKQSQIRRQLEKGDIKIAFDPNTESVTLLTKNDWQKIQRQFAGPSSEA